MHEHALEAREPSSMSRIVNLFFIPVVYNPSGAMGHATAPKLPSQEGRARAE
jgi:hypothetical protein